jgi:hypothetical protein
MPSSYSEPSAAYESIDVLDPQIAESIEASDEAADEAAMTLPQRGVRWVRAHRRPLGLVAAGVLTLAALANRRMRPHVLAGAAAAVRGVVTRARAVRP